MCVLFLYIGDVMEKNDLYYLNKTIKLAKKAAKKGDFPVGALIVKDNKIIATAYNKKEKSNIATKHAEIIAIEKACKKLKTWHLENCTLYTSLEPCIMCAGAIIQSRISNLIYCANNQNFGAIESNYEVLKHSKISVKRIENEEYLQLIKNFFKPKRK